MEIRVILDSVQKGLIIKRKIENKKHIICFCEAMIGTAPCVKSICMIKIDKKCLEQKSNEKMVMFFNKSLKENKNIIWGTEQKQKSLKKLKDKSKIKNECIGYKKFIFKPFY
jgi:hypothetical protein